MPLASKDRPLHEKDGLYCWKILESTLPIAIDFLLNHLFEQARQPISKGGSPAEIFNNTKDMGGGGSIIM